VGLNSLPLVSVVVLPGGITILAPDANPVQASYSTLVLGSPANVINEIGEALQLGRMHWASGLRQKIDDFGALAQDWDGEGADRPTAETVRTSKAVFEKLVAHAVRTGMASAPDIVPLSDGSIRFEWTVSNRELFITILEDRVEAQRWEPLDSIDSTYYAELCVSRVDAELEWLGA
jgi:hypothetical protein